MYSGNVLTTQRTEAKWIPALAAALGLPLIFLTLITISVVAISPASMPIATVVGALVVALGLRQILSSMRWPQVVLVTFWFMIAACVGGVSILFFQRAGAGELATGLLGLAVMFALQAARVYWQFMRAPHSA